MVKSDSPILRPVLVLCMVVLMVASALAQDRTVRVGVYDNPPKIYRTEDGTIAGFWADLVTEIADRQGWDVHWVWSSWSEDLELLKVGEIDLMVDVGYSSARAEKFEYSTEPVLLSWSRLYVRKGDERIQTIPDLEGMRIGALRGSINTDGPGGLRELIQGFGLHCSVVEYAEYESVFRDLELGVLDAGITNRDFGHLKAGGYQVQQTAIIFQPMGIYFAFPQHAVATPILKSAVDTIIHEFRQDRDSVYYKLLSAYFESGITERNVTPNWVKPALRVGLLVILGVLGAFILARLEIRRGRHKLEHAQQALLDSEQRYKEIFNSTSDAIFIHEGTTGKLVDVNRAVLEMYKCTRDEALNLSPSEFCSGEEPYTFAKAKESLQAVAAGKTQVFEWHARNLEGELFWVEVALKSAEFGGASWVIGTVRDIQDRKRMEGELIKSAKLQSLGVLAGGLAHDFNNLLTAVMGNVSMAISDLGKHSPVMPLLKDIESASQRAQGLTRQLLTFARGGDPVREVIPVQMVIQDAAEFVLRGSGTGCVFDLPDDLWAANVDPGQIGQVVQNLVINARQALADQGQIRISGANLPDSEGKNDARISITVDDDGPGFSATDQERAFDPYYTSKDDGNGLGLSICHSIVTRHQGKISLGVSPEGGARVVFELPALPGHVAAATPAAVGMRDLDRRVLVMDDDKMVRQLAGRMLEHFGCTVTEVAEGATAVEQYQLAMDRGEPFDLVIMDLTIPGGMGGKEAVGKILELDPGARVIVSSGYSRDPVLANFQDYGFRAVIVKPYRLAQLNAALVAALA